MLSVCLSARISGQLHQIFAPRHSYALRCNRTAVVVTPRGGPDFSWEQVNVTPDYVSSRAGKSRRHPLSVGHLDLGQLESISQTASRFSRFCTTHGCAQHTHAHMLYLGSKFVGKYVTYNRLYIGTLVRQSHRLIGYCCF